MEYLMGGNLAVRLQDSLLSLEHALNWMSELACGISFAHKRGVVHQDIKADSIFITNESDLKIGDFGLARLLAGRVGAGDDRKLRIHFLGFRRDSLPAYILGSKRSVEMADGHQQARSVTAHGVGTFTLCGNRGR